MKSDAAHVLVFDSGVGGLSIVEHLRAILPALSITYLADTRYFPYGMMDDAALVERLVNLLGQATRLCAPDMIVLACNSASTLALPALRERLAVPIVGVVPAIKPAASLTQTGVIGLLATPGTIRRDYTDELIGEFAPDCEVIRVGSARLVQVIEEQFRGVEPHADIFAEIMAPLLQGPRGDALDTVVLACTHFPLVKSRLAAAAPAVRHWIDSGEAIARRVRQLLVQIDRPAAGNRCDQVLVTSPELLCTTGEANFARYGFFNLAEFPTLPQMQP